MNKAFILGAGLGNRLRPLTARLPKPLVPLFHRPLASWAIDACRRSGIQDFAINTHHLPEAWENFSAEAKLTFFHEPILLETGGGLKNCETWMDADSILVHNGDIFSTLPLEQLIQAHEASGLPVTLALRSEGDARHIALDDTQTRVCDIREILGNAVSTHVFSGIYCVSPSFLALLPANEKISVIPAFLELARTGQLGAVVLDDGVWMDLGDRNSYLLAHRELSLASEVHPYAIVEIGAQIERSIIGPGACVAAGALIKDSVLWPNARVAGTASLDRCIVYSTEIVKGTHENEDL